MRPYSIVYPKTAQHFGKRVLNPPDITLQLVRVEEVVGKKLVKHITQWDEQHLLVFEGGVAIGIDVELGYDSDYTVNFGDFMNLGEWSESTLIEHGLIDEEALKQWKEDVKLARELDNIEAGRVEYEKLRLIYEVSE